VGGFTPGLDRRGKRLLSSGDIFLEKQILKAGYSCFYQPAMAVGHHIPRSRLEQRWFIRRYYWQGVSDAAMQLIEMSLSKSMRLKIALIQILALLRSPYKLQALILPTTDSKQFTIKCFTLITVGHIAGLIGFLDQ
jgi:hypothetical protein